MVNPLYLIAVFLIGAFLIPFVDRADRRLSLSIYFLVMIYACLTGLIHLLQIGFQPVQTQVFTAGFSAPLSIALNFGFKEAVLTLAFNIAGLLTGIFLIRKLLRESVQVISLLLLMMLGANGLVLTRDIFNAFVFLEILSISTYALIGLKHTKEALASGFKYVLASSLASALLLIGIAFTYRYSGTLNLDTWLNTTIPLYPGYKVALFLIIMAVVIELKPFPANGWALDVYQTANCGIASLLATVSTGALLFFFYKLLPLLPSGYLSILAVTGLVSFLLSNLTALRQKSAGRLLGYSSTAQTGLIIFVLAGLNHLGIDQDRILIIAAGLFITNFIAKSGLFWLKGLIKKDEIKDWQILSDNSLPLIMFGVFILSLVGFPPFPAFFAKFELVRILVLKGSWVALTAILLGSLLEAAYLLRWLGLAVKRDESEQNSLSLDFSKLVPILLGSVVLFALSLLGAAQIYGLSSGMLFPIMLLWVFVTLDFLPLKLKGLLAIGVIGFWGWKYFFSQMTGIGLLFAIILIGGSLVQIFGFLHHKDRKPGLVPLLVMLIFALGNLLQATTKLEFFLSWEFMTLASYLLILRGRDASKAALSYVLFFLGGAYLILTGLILIPVMYLNTPLYLQAGSLQIGLLASLLLGIGFIIKLGALGVHVWLPGAYTKADDEFTSVLSSVLSKAGVFGLILVLVMAKDVLNSHNYLLLALSWLGVLTAFFGALMAVFQEDVKKLLAYSSMSQLGYIILGLSLMSHLGWVSALYLTFNHMFFKALIFMAIAGVILRTGTRNMYEMGGLIKKMPISYISVLMGIIAVSGVPPLTGFGSKWFIYTSLIEHGSYFQAGLAFFASAIAFLYLYKLIHTVFLGQPKPDQKDVKEGPVWLLIPQVVFIMAIMGASLFPNYLTKPISNAVSAFIAKPEWLSWTGYNITLNSPVLHGNWNGNLVMLVTMGVFVFPLLWLLLVNAKTQKVKQFNIVFAAERPYKPWTTHFAHNMFAHYNKALGWLITPKITAFWQSVSEWTHSTSAMLSYIYTGNGQTYLLHIFMYILVIYIVGGVR
ncbi:MAG: proton-conducting transporter membrane subunit [Candidatus Cloacimonadaceae bacterium]